MRLPQPAARVAKGKAQNAPMASPANPATLILPHTAVIPLSFPSDHLMAKVGCPDPPHPCLAPRPMPSRPPTCPSPKSLSQEGQGRGRHRGQAGVGGRDARGRHLRLSREYERDMTGTSGGMRGRWGDGA